MRDERQEERLRSRAEEKLRESEHRYRKLFESANDGIFLLDETGFIDCNQVGSEMYGMTKDQLMGRSPGELSPERQPDGRFSAKEIAATIGMVMSGEPQRLEWQSLRADGTPFDVEITLCRVDLSGKACIQCIARDITERKRAENDLIIKSTVIASAIAGIALADLDGKINYANNAWLNMHGYDSLGEVSGTFPSQHVQDPNVAIAVIECIRTKGEWNGELMCRRRDGSGFPAELIANVVINAADQPVCILASFQDITERKLADDALRKSEERYRSIVNTTTDWIWEIDLAGNHTFSNQGVKAILGYEPDEFVGMNAISFLHEDDRLEVETALPSLIAGKKGWREWCLRWRHKDGTYRYLESNAGPLIDKAGECAGFLGADRDITERKQLEAEQLKTQKLESIGTFAGGIAHDFNNLLQGIFGYITMAKMTIADKERSLKMLEQAENALHQSVSLTTQLLTFSKGGKPVTKLLSLMPVIENAAKFALSGSQSNFRLDSKSGLLQTYADEGQIGQVMQNLVLNAEQAMPEGGTVVISIRNVLKPDNEHPQLPEGSYVEICVQDSGIGIPERYLQKIFDPYFTTKDKGSGLGLATSYSIIKNHGGLIDVITELGSGSTFRIYLPAARAEERVETPPAAYPAGRRGKILIMDDEELVRNIAWELITALGHEAEFVEQGAAAIEKYCAAIESGRPFDIVILDLTIRRGMGGRETMQRLREIDPAVKAIVSSGYSDDTVVADYQKYGFKACLAKPYKIKDLREALTALLSA